MYIFAGQVADGLRRVDTVRSVHREDSFKKKNKGFENKNGMSTEDVNTGAKWRAHFTNWQSKRNKAECSKSHLHHEQKFVDICKVGAANVSSKKYI